MNNLEFKQACVQAMYPVFEQWSNEKARTSTWTFDQAFYVANLALNGAIDVLINTMYDPADILPEPDEETEEVQTIAERSEEAAGYTESTENDISETIPVGVDELIAKDDLSSNLAELGGFVADANLTVSSGLTM